MATGTTLGSVFLPQDAESWPKLSAPAQRKPTQKLVKERLNKSLPRPASDDSLSTDANSTAPPDSPLQHEDVLLDIDLAEGRRRGEHIMSMLRSPASSPEKLQAPVVWLHWKARTIQGGCLPVDALLPPPPWQQTLSENAASISYAGAQLRVRRTFIELQEALPNQGGLRCKSAPATLRLYGADSNDPVEWGIAKDGIDGDDRRSLLASGELLRNQASSNKMAGPICQSHTFNKDALPFTPHCPGLRQALHAQTCPACARRHYLAKKYVVCMLPAGLTPLSCNLSPNRQTQPVQTPMTNIHPAPHDQTFNVASLPDEPHHIVLIDAEAKPEDHAKLSEEARAATAVAFDAEWKPDVGGSDNPIAVLQLAFPDSMTVYVVHVAALGGFPTDVEEMMESPDVKKIGFAIGHDLRKFKTSNLPVNDKSISDVRDDCHVTLSIGSTVPLGLAWASQEILRYEMTKIREITCSNWASQRLTIEQIEYAAMDAWVTLRLYQTLRRP